MISDFEVFMATRRMECHTQVWQSDSAGEQCEASDNIYLQSCDLLKQDLIRVNIRFGITCWLEAPLLISVYNSAWQMEK